MQNFKLKSFLGSITVLSGLLLSACGGGSVIANVISSDTSLNNVTIDGGAATVNENNITIARKFKSEFTVPVKFTFQSDGTVRLEGKTDRFNSGDYYAFGKDEEVKFVVTAADKIHTRTYTIKVTEAMPFVPYPADSCTLNSDDDDACQCLQDTTTGDVWTRAPSSFGQCYNSLMSESGVCNDSNILSEKGYIPNLNDNRMCGFNDKGWNLPSFSQLTTMKNYVSDVLCEAKGSWFNKHGFSGVDDVGVYLGQCDGNCILPFGNGGLALFIFMYNGQVGSGNQGYNGKISYGWGVHSRGWYSKLN